LAFGVDQVLSRAVLEEAFPGAPLEELAAILPFPRERCDHPGELLSRCIEVIELPGLGAAPHRDQASELLKRCDVLVAAARPGPAQGEGGTAETVERARAAGIEVIELRLDAASQDPFAGVRLGSG
jgi:hypothetical protein